MKIDEEKLKEILKSNPQVDGELVAKVLKEAKKNQFYQGGMVNFNIHLPYSSDTFEMAVQNSWDVAKID